MSNSLAPGRKQSDFVANHFIRLEPKAGKSNRFYWKCKYCGDDPNSKGAHIEGRDNYLPNHIQDSRKCPRAPVTARNEAARFLSSKKAITEPDGVADSSTIIDVDAITEADTVATQPRKKRKIQGTLEGFVDQPITDLQKVRLDRKWLRFLIHANVSFRSSENEYLNEFLNDLRPSYDAPSRYVLSHTLLDSEAADVFLKDSDRLQSSQMLTMLEDGWEDVLKRSIYGVVAAGVGMFPILMGLHDITGERGNAAKCLEIATDSLKLMGVPEGRNFIALTTDNPTTMQSFRRLFQQQFFWVLTLACFLHSVNTLLGEICAYPLIKKIISKANRTSTFFNGSHYWGGQLKIEAKRLHVTRTLRTNCKSRWYALILLCLCVACHRQPLSIICLREDAQKKTNGLSAVSDDVIETVLRTPTFWTLLNQLIRITKPLVDAIGNCEHREATLASCMLELLRCARTLAKMEIEEDEDAGFLAHAKATFDRRFTRVATPTHWLALFLHPSCRKLALSGDVANGRGKSLEFMIKAVLTIAKQWRWSEEKAKQLVGDLRAYHQFRPPFAGKMVDAKEWWELIPEENLAIKTLAVVLHSIVPHAAEVERLFSNLGGIQTPHRNGWLVDTMEKMGRVRNHLSYLLYEKKRAAGQSTRRKHGHMHTRAVPGIDGDLAKDLENPISWIPPLSTDGDGPEQMEEGQREDIVEKAYSNLEKVLADEKAGGEGGETTSASNQPSVISGNVVDFAELDRVDSGEADVPVAAVIQVVGSDGGSWDVNDLL
ncbi:DUF659 domain-containing protein [Favolaschia claudopus]|uniref:DUF659 domain-containing protein n=1 Tax=Favolaschia claudopus TaxID=2862362 RepID=A0AAW0DLS5_9AGAR